MLDFTWRVFCMTGNVDTYLLLKEIEQRHDDDEVEPPEISELDSTIS